MTIGVKPPDLFEHITPVARGKKVVREEFPLAVGRQKAYRIEIAIASVQRSVEKETPSFERRTQRGIHKAAKSLTRPRRNALILHAVQVYRVAVVSGE